VPSSRKSLGALEKQLSDALKGLGSEIPPGTTLLIDGVAYTVEALIAEISSELSVFSAERDARIAAKTKLAERRGVEPKAKALLSGLQAFLGTKYGPGSAELEKFGFSPRREPEPLTAEQLQAKVDRNRATRVARATRGSRQKAAIKGEVKPAAPASTSPGTAPSSGPAEATGPSGHPAP